MDVEDCQVVQVIIGAGGGVGRVGAGGGEEVERVATGLRVIVLKKLGIYCNNWVIWPIN